MIRRRSEGFALPGFSGQNSLIGNYGRDSQMSGKYGPDLSELVLSTVDQTCYDNCIKDCPPAGPQRVACIKGCNNECIQTCTPRCTCM